MKQILTLFALILWLLPGQVWAQLPDGSPAPDFTLTDIDGQTHHLYGYLAQGKVVALDFSATWCGPCWNYANTGAMETFWEEHGPNGDNTAVALFIEADESTGMNDLLGLTGSSQGNWVELIPFPIIDLVPANSTDEDYAIAYYPTLYMVCTDQTVYEVGQIPASEWAEWLSSCMLAAQVDNVEPAICGSDGSITLNVDGGIPPISYTWSNGSHASSLQNISGGTYSVTVTESNGKLVVIPNIVVDGPSMPVDITNSLIEDATCFNDPSGSVNISVQQGTAPYTYDWSNGANTQDIQDVTGGSYTVVVTDDNGCEVTETFFVDQPDPVEATGVLSPEYCQQENGIVELENITGGSGGYEVFATAGTVYGNSVVDLSAGPLTVTVEDVNGCTWEADFVIEEGIEPDLYFTPDPEINCVNTNIVITGYVNNGSGEYSFVWTTTDGNIVGPANQASITVDQEGTYTLTMDDVLTECTAVGSVFVDNVGMLPEVYAGEDVPMTCETPEITLAGEGDPSYTVSWTTPDGNILSGANTYTPVVNQPGTYVISVYNPATQCSNTDEVFVPNNQDPANAAYSYQTAGLSFVGTDLSTGSNLSGWTWNFGDGNSSSEQNPVYNYSLPGTYQVCLSVVNGCGTSETCQTVEVTSSTSVISVEVTIGNVACFGQSTGTINIDVSGGSGNYTYLWTGPGGATYNTQNIADLPAGSYILVISDDLGNVFSGAYTITEPGDIVLVGSTVVDNQCNGQTNGAITVDITGGVGPFLYSFNNGPAQPENTIQNLPGGIYECLVTDANGCAFTAGPYTIAEPAAVGVETLITGVRCFGESNGAITINATGGVAPYAYLWTDLNLTDTTLSGLAAGLYNIQVTDANGCINGFGIGVSEPDELIATVSQVNHASNTQAADGSIIIVAAGGTAPYTINWSNGAVGDTITGLAPGEYSYTITDINGCQYLAPAPIVIMGSTSTSEVAWAGALSMSPNPSNGQTVVRWEGLPSDRGTIQLFTTDGRMVSATELNARTGQWDLTSLRLQSGLYMVSVRIAQEVVTMKLVVL